MITRPFTIMGVHNRCVQFDSFALRLETKEVANSDIVCIKHTLITLSLLLHINNMILNICIQFGANTTNRI